MASTHKSLRSGTANKRPTTSIADGQIALNTNTTSPGLFFKDSTGATIIKVGPVHVGTTAPNASPAAGGSSGNSTGEVWLDTSLTPNGVKIWNGASWTNATPIGSTTVQGLLELATNAETQTGTDPDRAVTPAGLQSKVSDSTSTTSSTTIASSTAVKSAYDLANAALPKSGGTVTGNLEIGTTGSLSFEGATADAFETTIAVVDPTADRTITLPDTTGTVVTTGDTGTVTSTMIADGTIVNGDINASAAVDHSKLANITAGSVLLGNASNVPTATALSGDVTVNSTGVTAISSGVIVNADVNASAAIAGTKISPDFGSQTVQTTGIVSHALGTAGAPTVTFTGDTNTGIYSPGADQVAISTGGSGRLFVDSTGRVGIANSSPARALDITGTLRCSGRFESSSDAIISDWIYIGSASGARGVTSDAASRSLLFGINGSEVARFDTSGRLGVGTSSPAAQLDVAGGDIYVRTGGRLLSDTVQGYTGGATPLALSAANTITVSTASTERLRIDNSGRVGIGTSSPGYKLDVVGESNLNGLRIGLNGDTINSTTAGASSVIAFQINGNEKIRLDSSGRLGIGTNSPLQLLHLSSASAPLTQITYQGVGAAQTGVVAGGAYTIGVDASNGSTERLRIDSSGRLLVGTSSDVTNGLSYSKTQIVDSAWGSITLGTSATGISSGTTIGDIRFYGNSGNVAAYGLFGRIVCEADGTASSNADNPGRLVFSVTQDGSSSPTERVRLDNVGNFFVYSSGNDTVVAGNAAGSGTAQSLFTGVHTRTSTTGGGTVAYRIYNNGTTFSVSDARQKKNVETARDGYLEDLQQLRVVKYNWIDQADTESKELGLIAQEVAEVFPGLVQSADPSDPESTLGIKSSVFSFMLIKALQEAGEKIEALEARLSALESA